MPCVEQASLPALLPPATAGPSRVSSQLKAIQLYCGHIATAYRSGHRRKSSRRTSSGLSGRPVARSPLAPGRLLPTRARTPEVLEEGSCPRTNLQHPLHHAIAAGTAEKTGMVQAAGEGVVRPHGNACRSSRSAARRCVAPMRAHLTISTWRGRTGNGRKV